MSSSKDDSTETGKTLLAREVELIPRLAQRDKELRQQAQAQHSTLVEVLNGLKDKVGSCTRICKSIKGLNTFLAVYGRKAL